MRLLCRSCTNDVVEEEDDVNEAVCEEEDEELEGGHLAQPAPGDVEALAEQQQCQQEDYVAGCHYSLACRGVWLVGLLGGWLVG